jgi:DNA-binding transcriptional MerR regulator
MPRTISETAEASGVSAHTLRYYERAGLMRPVSRAGSGHRRYDDTDLAWIDFLTKLRSTGMPIRQMRRYAELVFAGEHTEPERLTMLEAHRDQVHAQLAETERCLARIDYKITLYRERTTP